MLQVVERQFRILLGFQLAFNLAGLFQIVHSLLASSWMRSPRRFVVWV
jgi:hypothetical protein